MSASGVLRKSWSITVTNVAITGGKFLNGLFRRPERAADVAIFSAWTVKLLHVRAGQGGTVSAYGACKGRDRFTRHALDCTKPSETIVSGVHLFIGQIAWLSPARWRSAPMVKTSLWLLGPSARCGERTTMRVP
jgi:hypothetical protein